MIRKLSIIIPAYDKGRTIHLILDKQQNVILPNVIENKSLL